jgi:SSS family solute:Na+ symporter
MMPAMAMFVASRLVHLSAVDVFIIAFYFVLVLGIGFYLRGRARTGEDFFMAGREMTAWVAGLSFLSANLGALELMGWAAGAYQHSLRKQGAIKLNSRTSHINPPAAGNAGCRA